MAEQRADVVVSLLTEIRDELKKLNARLDQGQTFHADASASAELEIGEQKQLFDEDEELFGFWVKVFNKNPKTCKLTQPRKEKIRARRREGCTQQKLMQAIEGAKYDRNLIEGDYDDIWTILKSSVTVDRHVKNYERAHARSESKNLASRAEEAYGPG